MKSPKKIYTEKEKTLNMFLDIHEYNGNESLTTQAGITFTSRHLAVCWRATTAHEDENLPLWCCVLHANYKSIKIKRLIRFGEFRFAEQEFYNVVNCNDELFVNNIHYELIKSKIANDIADEHAIYAEKLRRETKNLIADNNFLKVVEMVNKYILDSSWLQSLCCSLHSSMSQEHKTETIVDVRDEMSELLLSVMKEQISLAENRSMIKVPA